MCFSKNSSGWKVSGIVSFGPNAECGSDLPGVYTKVAYFKDWISKVLDVHEKRTPSENFSYGRSSQDDYHYRHNCDRVEETTIQDGNSGHRSNLRSTNILLYCFSIFGHRKYISYQSL